MSLCKLIPSLLVATLAVGMTTTRAEAQVNLGSGLVINDVDLTGVNFNAATGKLTATGGTVAGTLAGLPFTTNLTNFALQLVPPTPQAPEGCSVLDLALAPIDIDLLGLHVDTSAICLSITALPGEGLLGDLLCGLAGGVDSPAGLTNLLGGLPGILTQALGGAAADSDPATPAEPADICDGECEVLDLALGPVDLTLLGLNVFLDNCDEGPVQVCVSASEGEGLLGGLLCGLTGNGGLLGSLSNLQGLVDTVLGALGNANLTGKQVKQLSNRLAGQLVDRLVDGTLSAADLDKVTKTITQALR